MSRPTSAANGPASDDSSINVSTRPASAEHPRESFDSGQVAEQIFRGGTKPKKHINENKTLWVTVFKCFQSGKHGHKLPKCTQCSQAYYCNAECQRKHWKKHKPVCRAAVAAMARRATRERLARAVRDKGKDKVEHSAEDDLCVICQDTTVDAVEVSVREVVHPLKHESRIRYNSLTNQRLSIFDFACMRRRSGIAN